MPKLLLAMTIGALLLLGAQRGDQADLQLQAAINKEVVEGDLKGAIEQYKKIVAQQGVSRSVVATALLHLGQCYEKLGQADARKTYERLLREYADQSDLAVAARSRLLALNRTSPPGSAPALAIRRIYEGLEKLDPLCNGLSSDIRYLSLPDRSTGNIAVVDLRTGEKRRVTNSGTINQAPGEFGECSVFSPDDKQIAFSWHKKGGGPSEIRTIGTDGSKLRVLHSATQALYIQPFDWSSDGKQILAELYFKDRSSQILSISATDGSVRALKRLDFGGSEMNFSPDGRYVAYSTPAAAGSQKQDIFVITADGSRETPLIRHPADDYVLGWSPDGKKLFFASDRTGSYGVWSIDVENGQPRGAPVLAKADIGPITPIRFVNGTLFYQVVSQMADVYIATVDPETGKLQSKPTLARNYFSGSNVAPDWSPDGNFLAYRSVRGPANFFRPPPLLSILNLKTGEERQIQPALDGMDFNDGPRWSPDGRSLLVIGLQGSPEAGIHKVEVDSGATTALVETPPGQWILHAVWSRDGKSVFYSQGGNPTRILRRDLTTGKDLEVTSLASSAGLALSPDGQWLAFTSREAGVKPVMKLSVVPAGGGEVREIVREIFSVSGGAYEGIVGPTWTSDGRYIFFTKVLDAGKKHEFWRATPDGRLVGRVYLEISRGSSGVPFRFSPDGRRIAFSAGEWKNELWALENISVAKNALH